MTRPLAIVTLLFAAACCDGSRAEEELDQQVCFETGGDGYHTFRIPSLIVSTKGTLLAFCEGRKNDSSDSGDIDLVLKRSLDGGDTWGPMQVVWDDGEHTCGNPCPVVNRSTGAILLLLTHNQGEDKQEDILAGAGQGTRTVWLVRSVDDGDTWSPPVEITSDVKQPDWTWYATGPGVGIQTESGRLVVPCDNYVAVTKVRQSHVILSDDGGETWKLGGVVGPDCNECQVAERSDDSLLLNMRSYRGNNRRVVATSSDGGLTWSEPTEDAALLEPVCQASLVRYSGGKPLLLFSNPASERRENMTVRLSSDDGRSWPAARLLHAGPAAYSCLATLDDGRIACLYERGENRPYETIILARFPLEWLEAGKP